jgi:hypothetical protein
MTVELIVQGGHYDEDSKRVTLYFLEGMPAGTPDPINWRPSKKVTVSLPPGQVTVDPLVQPGQLDVEPEEETKPGKTPKG